MYLDFFGLRELPFGVTPDPAFLYLSQTHREALETLRSDLATDRGFMALLGEPGLGKTTLLNELLDEWRERSRVVFLFQTQCDSQELFRYLLAELGIDAGSMGLVAMHHKLNRILFQEMLAGRRFILIIDEAQNLDDSVLETVRLLSNFETEHAKLLNIVIAGQTQLADKLNTPGLGQLRQRIGVLSRLRPLSAPETAEYIQHRLDLAAHCRKEIFTLGAIQAIAKSSRGVPRNINHLCHHALYAAAVKGGRTINLEMAQNVIAKLEGSKIELKPLPILVVAEAPIPISTPVAMPPAAIAPPTYSPSFGPAPSRAAQLTYRPSGKSNAKRWGPAAIACGVLLLLGTVCAIPSVRRFAWQEYKNLSANILSSPPQASGAASSPEPSSVSEVSSPTFGLDRSKGIGQLVTEVSALNRRRPLE